MRLISRGTHLSDGTVISQNQSSDGQVGALTTCQDAQGNVETSHASRTLADMIMYTHATYP